MKSKTYSDVIQEVKQGFQSRKDKTANWNNHHNFIPIFKWDIFIFFRAYETLNEIVAIIDFGNWNKSFNDKTFSIEHDTSTCVVQGTNHQEGEDWVDKDNCPHFYVDFPCKSKKYI